MFSKVLIANRGAIAVRIIRTLRALNIRAVAVYAECDADSLHVRQADEAYCLGAGGAAQTYLDMDKILSLARMHGVEAIHPGYGFLSENAEFVRRCEAAGMAFIGPTAEQIELFGLKHTARRLALEAGLALSPGTGLLTDIDTAVAAAEKIGFPVMLKSTAGGGGIGMQCCYTQEELKVAFASVKRLGANNFADDGVFLEKYIAHARHIEIQVFGDGKGNALAIGERDCSSQRRNQKVIEECPAPNLPDTLRNGLQQAAETLLARVNYRNAGTVEFIVDADTQEAYFLEVNTRLQVEHGVTEAVYGLDLVHWMVSLAAGEDLRLDAQRLQLKPQGHAIQVRVYAEDPFLDFKPNAGLLTEVTFPEVNSGRIDHWVEAGVEVPSFFDPMLAKIIRHGETRAAALALLETTLADTRLYGIETNLDYLRCLMRFPSFTKGEMTTRSLSAFHYQPARIDVIQPGTQTTIQDIPGRIGYWDVGVPPSGPFDSLSFRLGNRLLGNPESASGLEMTLQGPTLRFSQAAQIVIVGAEIEVTCQGQPLPLWEVISVSPGQDIRFGRVRDAGARAYLCIRGGLMCPAYLGSRSTFTLGQFGGHNGRALRTGDVLKWIASEGEATPASLPFELRPSFARSWQLRVIYGPHGAPDFFTEQDIAQFFAHEWEVHYHSSRTGIRLIGPKPEWARKDGGEAGLHPSNLHDNAYAFGTVDFTGDMPVILGPDGPSLGGFVCPATVIQADLWKLGQVHAGDKIRFVNVGLDDAVDLETRQRSAIDKLSLNAELPLTSDAQALSQVMPGGYTPILAELQMADDASRVVYRAAGDHFLLVEYGPQVLDIRLRFRVHALLQWLQAHPLEGLRELTPGIRSLQVHYDSQILSYAALIGHLQDGERYLATRLDQLQVPSRIVHIPLSWDDEACRQAVEKYSQSVRKDAPWCPSNLEFIRRINGLDSVDAVKQIVFDASYLVLGLGDVYLGAPVATPVDPRHRLVTTKYNPARTWTAENSVGIGGSYLCVYGMEGPGGYQFIGRTLQMWNRYRQTREFAQPWLLRFFDQIRFYEVSHEELTRIRRDFPQGRYPLRIEESHFSLSDYGDFLTRNAGEIARFQAKRTHAFEAELAHWHATGQFNFKDQESSSTEEDASWSEDAVVVDSPVAGSIWQADLAPGQIVKEGETLMILESMKMEIPVLAPVGGQVTHVLPSVGQQVRAGQSLVVIDQIRQSNERVEETKV